MSIGKALLPEYDLEMAITRRLIERVPSERGEWKPHEKSFALGHLTQLVSTMPGWITNIIGDRNIDIGSGSGYTFETTDTLLGEFDRHVREAREALESVDDSAMAEDWTLTLGEQVLVKQPVVEGVRHTINHLIHHRGQLSVYLRLIDVPVPSIYGPTADEKWTG